MWLWWSLVLGLGALEHVVGSDSRGGSYHHSIVKRDTGSFGGALDAIREEAANLPENAFDGDILLLQRVDSGARVTRYLLASDNSSIVFERHSNDRGVESIVLSADEDKLPSNGIKRRFVVLRADKGGPLYHVVYAYLRDFDHVRDKSLTAIGDNGQWVIEWDSWDYRGPGKERFATFGFSNCGPSAIIPCGYNDVLSPDSSIRPLGVKERWVPSSSRLKNSPMNNNMPKIRGEPGYDVNDNAEFYSDLDTSKEHNRLSTKDNNQQVRGGQDNDDSMNGNTQRRQQNWKNGGSGYDQSGDKKGQQAASAAHSRTVSVPVWAGGPSGYFYQSSSTSSVSSSSSSKSLMATGNGNGDWVASTQSRGQSVVQEMGKKTELWVDQDGSGGVKNSKVEALEIGGENSEGIAFGSGDGRWSSISKSDEGKMRLVGKSEGDTRWSSPNGRKKRSLSLLRSEDTRESEVEETRTRFKDISSTVNEKSSKDRERFLSDAMTLMTSFGGSSGSGKDKEQGRDVDLDSLRGTSRVYQDRDSDRTRESSYKVNRERDLSVTDRDRDRMYTDRKREREYSSKDESYAEKDRKKLYSSDREWEANVRFKGSESRGKLYIDSDRDKLYMNREKEREFRDSDKLVRDKELETLLGDQEKVSVRGDTLSRDTLEKEKIAGRGDALSREREKDALYIVKKKGSTLYNEDDKESLYKKQEKETLYTDRDRGPMYYEKGGNRLSRERETQTLYGRNEKDTLYAGKEKDTTLYKGSERDDDDLFKYRELERQNQRENSYLGKGDHQISTNKYLDEDQGQRSTFQGGSFLLGNGRNPSSTMEASRTETKMSVVQHTENVRSGVGGRGAQASADPSSDYMQPASLPRIPEDKPLVGSSVGSLRGGSDYSQDEVSNNGGLTKKYRPKTFWRDETKDVPGLGLGPGSTFDPTSTLNESPQVNNRPKHRGDRTDQGDPSSNGGMTGKYRTNSGDGSPQGMPGSYVTDDELSNNGGLTRKYRPPSQPNDDSNGFGGRGNGKSKQVGEDVGTNSWQNGKSEDEDTRAVQAMTVQRTRNKPEGIPGGYATDDELSNNGGLTRKYRPPSRQNDDDGYNDDLGRRGNGKSKHVGVNVGTNSWQNGKSEDEDARAVQAMASQRSRNKPEQNLPNDQQWGTNTNGDPKGGKNGDQGQPGGGDSWSSPNRRNNQPTDEWGDVIIKTKSSPPSNDWSSDDSNKPRGGNMRPTYPENDGNVYQKTRGSQSENWSTPNGKSKTNPNSTPDDDHENYPEKSLLSGGWSTSNGRKPPRDNPDDSLKSDSPNGGRRKGKGKGENDEDDFDSDPYSSTQPKRKFTGRRIVKAGSSKRQNDDDDDDDSSSIYPSDKSETSAGQAHVVAKGAIIANAVSVDNKVTANAVDRGSGLGAVANAINGSQAAANALSTTKGDAQSRSETYGSGGARSNSLSTGTGAAFGSARSKGDGDAEANAISRANGAVANALGARGGHSQANAISNKKGDALSSSVALKGGASRSSATARGLGSAAAASLTEGGGNSYSAASAQGGGSANSNSQAKDGGTSHSIASSVGGGTSMSTSVSKGGGATVADAMAEQGDSVASAVQDSGEDDTPFDPDTFADRVKKMPDATFKVVNPQLGLGRSLKNVHPNDSGKKNDEMNPDVYLPGWKTQYATYPLQPKVTLRYESDVFYGLGSCPQKEVGESDRDEADSPEALLRYYMSFLRSWCLPKEVKTMKGLIKKGILVQDEKLLQLNPTSYYLRRSKLSASQLEDLGIAFEMHLFTILINKKRPSSSTSRGPSENQLTRSVGFLEDLLIQGVVESRSIARPHYIHLTRQLILVAKVTYTKLLQDFDVLDACENCVVDKELNTNDRMELMALVHWMIKGLGPVDKGASFSSAVESFMYFYSINNAAIEARVANYAN